VLLGVLLRSRWISVGDFLRELHDRKGRRAGEGKEKLQSMRKV
jgi:hypothetical protein